MKPHLGRLKLLHQAYAGTGVCLHCGKPMDDWQSFDTPKKIDWISTFPRPLEECVARIKARYQ